MLRDTNGSTTSYSKQMKLLLAVIIIVFLVLVGMLTFTSNFGMNGNYNNGVKGDLGFGFHLMNPMATNAASAAKEGYSNDRFMSHYNPLAFERAGYGPKVGTVGGGWGERETPGITSVTPFTTPGTLNALDLLG